ncbi:MAG: STAS domain-containing protein [Cyanobacteria bacterium P01_G01_bin.54]
MDTQEICGEDYSVQYDAGLATVTFQGELSLANPSEYQPIADLLTQAIANSSTMTLSLQALTFLNSSGISMLSKFILSLRRQPSIQLMVLGSEDIPWQGKSLKNLQKLLPSLELKLLPTAQT